MPPGIPSHFESSLTSILNLRDSPRFSVQPGLAKGGREFELVTVLSRMPQPIPKPGTCDSTRYLCGMHQMGSCFFGYPAYGFREAGSHVQVLKEIGRAS